MPAGTQARCITDIRAPKLPTPTLFSFEKRNPNIADRKHMVWLKRVGEEVKPEDILLVISTNVVVVTDQGDGAVEFAVEVRAAGGGTLTEVLISDGIHGVNVHSGDVVGRMTCR